MEPTTSAAALVGCTDLLSCPSCGETARHPGRSHPDRQQLLLDAITERPLNHLELRRATDLRNIGSALHRLLVGGWITKLPTAPGERWPRYQRGPNTRPFPESWGRS